MKQEAVLIQPLVVCGGGAVFKGVPLESSLRKACLVRVRHCVAHRTLATALGFVEKSEYAVTSLKLNEMPKTN